MSQGYLSGWCSPGITPCCSGTCSIPVSHAARSWSYWSDRGRRSPSRRATCRGGGGGRSSASGCGQNRLSHDNSSSRVERLSQRNFLRDPRVRQWLDGVEPAWTLLAFDSLRALRREPSADATAIPIANALNAEEMTGSAVARNTRQRRPAADRNRQPVTRRGRRDARADQMAGLRPDRCVSAPQGHQRT